MRYRAVLLLAMLLTAACAPEPTLTPTAPRPAAAAVDATNPPLSAPQATATPVRVSTKLPERKPTGKFVFAPGDGSIWLQDAATGHAQVIVKATANFFADSPAFSPDGQHIVFSITALDAQGVAQVALHLVGIDGQNEHILIQPPDIQTSFNWPVFSPDGQWVYYTASSPEPPNKQHTEIERVPAQGGAAVTVLADAHKATLSADGKRMTFLRFNFDTFTASLWVADADGKNPTQILADDVFAALGTPHFSPDGAWILFAASGPPNHPLPGALNLQNRECAPRLLCALAAPVYADGLPWDIWLASSDGKTFRQVTKIGADSPAPAWSRDGQTIAFFDTTGIYLVRAQGGSPTELSTNGGHGDLDWWAGR